MFTLAQSIPASDAKVAQERMAAVELGRGGTIMSTIAVSLVLLLWLLRRVLLGKFGGYKGYGRH